MFAPGTEPAGGRRFALAPVSMAHTNHAFPAICVHSPHAFSYLPPIGLPLSLLLPNTPPWLLACDTASASACFVA